MQYFTTSGHVLVFPQLAPLLTLSLCFSCLTCYIYTHRELHQAILRFYSLSHQAHVKELKRKTVYYL